MLIDFTINNVMSYRDEATFSMLASQSVKECENGESVSNVTLTSSGRRILRAAAIYGANGSGKSCMIAAMDVFRTMVLRSFVDENLVGGVCRLYYQFEVANASKPVSMQMIFLSGGICYRYGFQLYESRVMSEWLFMKSEDGRKECYCFKREGQDISINTKTFKGASGVASKTRTNALFLSTAAQFNVAVAMDVKEWFRYRFNVLSGLTDDTLYYTAHTFMNDALIRQQILDMLGQVDDCIKGVHVNEVVHEMPAQPFPSEILAQMGVNLPAESKQRVESHELEIKAAHQVYNSGVAVGECQLDFKAESLGTNKLFALLGPFFDTIRQGGVLVFDEFGTSLHTQLSMALLRLFFSVLNKRGAQLIVATHDTNLLRKDLLRRDQIWFAEKNAEGASDLYSLVEYKINQATSVRNDASFAKDYLLGKYGAIPYFGNIDKFVAEYGKE